MIYYIEIKHPNTGERIAGELKTNKQFKQMTLVKKVMEFAEDQGICPSYAAENCLYKIEKGGEQKLNYR